MKYTSPIFSGASGSLAGMTFSHNKGGNYVRARAIPTNPNTLPQQTAKAILSLFSSIWKTLTQAQMDAWQDYADVTPFTNSLGNEYTVSGQNMFVRSSTFRANASLSFLTDAPVTGGQATLTSPTSIGISAATQLITGNIDATDPWATSVAGALVISASRNLPFGTNSSKHNTQIAGNVKGATAMAPTTFSVTAPFAMSAGSKVTVKFRVSDGEGKLSPIQRTLHLIAA